MFGLGEPANEAEQKADHYVNRLPGGAGTKELRQLRALFTENSDPSPIEIYKAWCGTEEFASTEEMKELVSNASGIQGFDPAEDPTPSIDKIQVKETYERALNEDMDDEAVFLRGLPYDHQRRFSSFLRREFLGER